MHTVGTLTNATLAPAAIMVLVGSVWLIVHRAWVRSHWIIAALGGTLGLFLIVLRGIAVLWPPVFSVSPRLTWIGIAAWVALISLAMRYRITLELRPTEETHDPPAAPADTQQAAA